MTFYGQGVTSTSSSLKSIMLERLPGTDPISSNPVDRLEMFKRDQTTFNIRRIILAVATIATATTGTLFFATCGDKRAEKKEEPSEEIEIEKKTNPKEMNSQEFEEYFEETTGIKIRRIDGKKKFIIKLDGKMHDILWDQAYENYLKTMQNPEEMKQAILKKLKNILKLKEEKEENFKNYLRKMGIEINTPEWGEEEIIFESDTFPLTPEFKQYLKQLKGGPKKIKEAVRKEGLKYRTRREKEEREFEEKSDLEAWKYEIEKTEGEKTEEEWNLLIRKRRENQN